MRIDQGVVKPDSSKNLGESLEVIIVWVQPLVLNATILLYA